MTNKLHLEHQDINMLLLGLAEILNKSLRNVWLEGESVKIYPVPRGGVPVAYGLLRFFDFEIVDHPKDCDLIIDDIIDSGATQKFFAGAHPNKPFFALIDKARNPEYANKWIVFPWETNETEGIGDNVRRIIQYIGDDPNREGLTETPARVAKAWKHWTSGYNVNIGALLKVFKDGANGYDEMVVVKNIPVYSKCEHHLADIFGTATIAYIPNGHIVGLSKLSRVTDAFARRLQVQERLTSQIANALDEHLKPKGVGVIIKARHMCMESRGICQQGHHTVTSALRGVMKTEAAVRAEFMALAQ